MANQFPEKFGKYRIIEEVGRGGFADVYKAIDTTLDRTVALKFLEPRLLREPTFVERFQREAKLAANLKHPHIVFVHEFGWEAGTVYIAMEFLEGRTLKEVILQEGALHPRRIVNMVGQIASALDYAHGRGLVHRDIKPANVMVGADDQVTVMDFGLAKAATQTALTTTGRIFGTPEYMSPEQAEGMEEPDARSDVYSLGVVAYEMFTGKVPFSGTPLSVMRGHADKLPPRPSQINPAVSPAVEAVLLKTLAKKRAERYQSAGEMAQALTAAVETRVEEKVEREERPTVRGGLPVWSWGAIALVVALAIGGVIFLATQGGKPTTTPVPVAQAATPTATVTATATPMPPTDTPTSTSTPTKTPTPVPPTATPIVPTPTPTPLPPTNTPTNAPTDTPTPVLTALPAMGTPTPYVVTTKPTPTPAAELTAADFRIASPIPQADGTYPKDTPLEFGFILKNNETRLNIPLTVICVLVLDEQGEEKSRSCISPYLQLPPRGSQSFSIKAESGLASGQYYAEIWYATWRGAVAQNSEGYKAAINFTIK